MGNGSPDYGAQEVISSVICGLRNKGSSVMIQSELEGLRTRKLMG
jgi:hypothetical protein